MTWTCSTCGRDYPDSSIGVPGRATADQKEACEVCWVSPVGTSRFVRPDSVDAEEVLRG